MIERLSNHLLISPGDVPPSRPDMAVIGTFNPGAVRWRGTTYLLVRVVEAPAEPEHAAGGNHTHGHSHGGHGHSH